MEFSRRTAIQGVVLAAVLVSPFALVRLLPMVASTLPDWLVGTLCVGFLCSWTLLLAVVPFFLGVGWVLATLSDRGYLPGA